MATTASELRDTIVTADKRFMESYNASDAAGVAHCYTEGGQLLPPNSEPVTGKPAIQAFWQGAMDMGITRVTLETVEVEAAGETAYEVGTFTLEASGSVADQGKYLVVWKRDGGDLRLHRDIWCTSRPA
jgi:ketosteroid isomerase-like protein